MFSVPLCAKMVDLEPLYLVPEPKPRVHPPAWTGGIPWVGRLVVGDAESEGRWYVTRIHGTEYTLVPMNDAAALSVYDEA